MKQNLYVIYDVLAEECSPVMQAPNDKVAVRAYYNLIVTVAEKSRKDYQLWLVGSVDTSTGEVVGSTGVLVINVDAVMASDAAVEEVL